ncbi:MAG TPA: ABC transporter permease [Pyrinomonadaceae bacterium]|nr:ABC transporter permease [Pyrinomonadaceae bacterium]
MPYEVFLAFRHLRSRSKRRVASVTTVIALAGIAMGVAALIVALALANGFRDEMRDKILRGTAHITVVRSDGQPMRDYRVIAERVRKIDGVRASTGSTYDGALLIGPKGSSYAVLRGIDTSSEQTKSDIAASVVEGSVTNLFDGGQKVEESSQIFLGAELAARSGLQVGDHAEIIAANSGAASTGATKRRAQVIGIFRTGLFEYDSTWIYLPLETAAALTGGDSAASVVSVQVRDIYEVKELSSQVRELLGSSYTVVDWQEANRPLFTALTLERRIGFIIIGLIILIAALNITTTLILVVTERRSDIAILNAMGATRPSIMSIFVIEGAITGLLGALTGVFLGVMTIVISNYFRLISLPPDVYSIDHVPLNLDLRDVVLAGSVAIVLSIIATIYPARSAAKMRPAELLRDAG